MEHFRKYLGTLISTTLPHEDCPLDRQTVLNEVKTQRAMLARYTSDSHIFCDKIGGGVNRCMISKYAILDGGIA